jgi:type IV secretion system protein TrbL
MPVPALPDPCSPPTPLCVISKLPGAIAQSGFDSMAKSLGEGYVQMLKLLTTFWVKIEVPTLDSAPGGVITVLRDLTWWWLLVIAFVGAVIGAAKLAVNQDVREGQLIVKGLLRTVLVAGAGVGVINILSSASDGTSSWIIDRAMAGHTSEGFSYLLGSSGAFIQLEAGILFLVGLFGIIASLAQLMLLVFRAAFVTVMAGILPLAAAASVTSSGVEWFNRLAGYTLAAIAYKPVAALIYAAAFKLMDGSSGPLGVLEGLALVILAILALPSMMRLFVPAMGAVSSGASGMFGAGVGAAAVAAQGANVLTGHVGGGTGSTSAAAAAPEGASMAETGPKALDGGGEGSSGGPGPSGSPRTPGGAGTSGSASAAAGGGAAGSAAAAGGSAGTSLVVIGAMQAIGSGTQAAQQSAKDVTGDEQ